MAKFSSFFKGKFQCPPLLIFEVIKLCNQIYFMYKNPKFPNNFILWFLNFRSVNRFFTGFTICELHLQIECFADVKKMCECFESWICDWNSSICMSNWHLFIGNEQAPYVYGLFLFHRKMPLSWSRGVDDDDDDDYDDTGKKKQHECIKSDSSLIKNYGHWRHIRHIRLPVRVCTLVFAFILFRYFNC